VLGVMERPTGKTEADKWDAWRAVGGMRKTEAKRRYIECLIEVWWSVFFLASHKALVGVGWCWGRGKRGHQWECRVGGAV